MPAFRNQDVTENLIKTTADEMSTTNLTGDDAAIWNKACDKVYGDMIADGLLTTADMVKNYRIKV